VERTDKAVATVADKLGDKALEYLNALEQITKQYAPDVLDAAMGVVQMQAAGNLLTALGICAGIYLFWRFAAKPLTSIYKGNYDWDIPAGAALVAGSVGSGIGAIIAVIILLDIWVWTALFNPKLYLAYKLLGKVL
jgi:hypothetical protein